MNRTETEVAELTASHWQILTHSLGIKLFEAVMARNKSETKFPNQVYRNYYNTSQDHPTINHLVSIGFMEQNKSNKQYYHVTPKGILAVKDFFKKHVIFVPVMNRDFVHLMRQIDFYCYWMHYTLTSSHIINDYFKYYVKGEYLSHSVRNVISFFKRDLKRIVKPSRP